MKVVLRDVTKVFPVSLRDMSVSLLKVILGKCNTVPKGRGVVAVDGASFDIHEGERVGVIGPNGAGKTTLLQLIAGLAEPDSGTIEIDGHIDCLMLLGVGIREDYSGRENIYLDGEANGHSKAEVDEMIDSIIEFSELGEFIEYPVRTYSSGMKARLAFSMITHIEPEILIIDEALSVGDAHFCQKASRKMKEICAKGKILIVVSHSLAAIVAMCNRCLWMDKGRIVMDGDPNDVTAAYRQYVRKNEEADMQERLRSRIRSRSLQEGAEIVNLKFCDEKGLSKKIFDVGETVVLRLHIKVPTRLGYPDLRLSIQRGDGIMLLDSYASDGDSEIGPIESELTIEVPMGTIWFGQDTYDVHVELLNRDLEPENQLLATLDTVLKVENPEQSFDAPAFFHPAEWRLATTKNIGTHMQ